MKPSIDRSATTYEYPNWFNSTPSPYDAAPVRLLEDVDVVVWIGESLRDPIE